MQKISSCRKGFPFMVATLPTFFHSPVFVICERVCVHVCMDMDTHGYVHTCGGPWLMTAIILDRSSTLFIVAGSLHQSPQPDRVHLYG